MPRTKLVSSVQFEDGENAVSLKAPLDARIRWRNSDGKKVA